MGYFDDDILDYGYSSWGDTGAEGDDDYTYAPVVEERGFFGDVRTSALRGLSQLSESAWRGAELLPVVGKKIDEADVAEGIAERREQSPWMAQDMSEFQGDEGLVKRGFTGMVEALPTSVGPAAAGAAVGTALLPGLGTAAGAAIGAGLGTLGFFTASEGRRAYKEGIEQGMAEDEAFWYGAKKGGAEGGLEAGAMALDILIPFSGKITKGVRMSRKAAKEALEAEGKEATTTAIAKLRGQAKEPQSIGEYLKGTDWRTHRNNMVGIMGTENLTEQAQLELGAAIDRQHGLEGEVTWEERKETIAVTTWMSLLFGGLGAGVNVNERNKLKKGLESKNPEVRNAAAEQFRGLLPEERQADFDEVWGDVRENNTPFVISQDISDRAKEVHEETLMASAAQMGGLPDGITVTERVKANKAQEDIVSKPIAETTETVTETLEDAGMPENVTAPAAEEVSSGIAEETVAVATEPASTAIKPGANRQAEVQAQASVAPQEAVAVTKTEVQATAPAAGGTGGTGGGTIATPGPAATPGVQEQPAPTRRRVQETPAPEAAPEPIVPPSTRMSEIQEELKTADPMSDRFDELSTEYMALADSMTETAPEPTAPEVSPETPMETRELTTEENLELVNAQAERKEIMEELQSLAPEELTTPEAKTDATRAVELTNRIEELNEISGVAQEAEVRYAEEAQARDAREAKAPKAPKPKQERKIGKKADVQWTRDPQSKVSSAKDRAGKQWIIQEKGKSRKVLWRDKEEIGTYKNLKEAKAAAKALYAADPTTVSVGKGKKFDNYLYKGDAKVNSTKIRKKFVAEQIAKELSEGTLTEKNVGKRITQLNKYHTKAALTKALEAEAKGDNASFMTETESPVWRKSKPKTATNLAGVKEGTQAQKKRKVTPAELKATKEKVQAEKNERLRKEQKERAAKKRAAKKTTTQKVKEASERRKEGLIRQGLLPGQAPSRKGKKRPKPEGETLTAKQQARKKVLAEEKKAKIIKETARRERWLKLRKAQAADDARTITRSKSKGETRKQQVMRETLDNWNNERVGPSKAPTGEVTYENNVPEAYKQHVAMVQQFLADLGIRTPKISVINDNLAGDLAMDLLGSFAAGRSQLADRARRRAKATSNASVNYNPLSNTIELNMNPRKLDALSPEEVVEIFLHEAGHVVERASFHQAPKATQEKIIAAYGEFIMNEVRTKENDMGNIDLHEMFNVLKQNFYAANQSTSEPNYQLLSDPMFEHFQYLTSFQEWFADNVSRWATTDAKPQSTIEKFFKSVADSIKQFISAMTGTPVLKLPNAEIKSYLDAMHARAEAKHEIVEEGALLASDIADIREDINQRLRDDVMENVPAYLKQIQRIRQQELFDALLGDPSRSYTPAQLTEVVNPSPLLDTDDSVAATAPPRKQSTREQRLAYWDSMNTRTAKFQRETNRITDKFLSAGKKAFRSGIDIIGEYSPTVKRVVQQFIMTTQQKTADRMARVERFAEMWKGLSETQRTELTYILNNGYKDQLPAFYKEVPGAQQAIEEAQVVLAELKAEADANGIDFDGSVKDAYWPRIVRDQAGLQKILETDPKSWSLIQNEIKAEAKARGVEELTPDEREQVITSFLNTGRYYGTIGKARSQKARNIVHVTHQMIPFYEHGASALTNHIAEMTEKIETAKFTGSNKARVQVIKDLKKAESLQRLNKKPEAKARYAAEVKALREKLTNPENTEILDESLDATMRKLLESDTKVTGEQVDEMIQIIRARLMEKGMHGVIGTGRNFGLMSTLADMTSLVTQASEMVFSVFTGGKYLSTPWTGLGKAIRKESFIKGTDVGLKQALMEYQRDSDSKSTKWVSKLLDGVGFSKVDITMKETFMNTQILRAQKMSKAELQKEWGAFFGPEFEAFYAELKANEVGQHTQLMAYSKLMDYQPTDVIANPQAYMEGGNWRILYMLKTFQLRQANRVYTDLKNTLHLAKAGDTKAAFEAGVRLASFIVLFSLAGATKDEIRDMILGRELPAREHFWNNMMQLAMFSRYDYQEMQKDGIGKTLLGNLQPPTPFLDLPYKFAESFIRGEDINLKVATMIPIIGKPLYARYMKGGQTTTANQTKGGFGRRIESAIMSEDRGELTAIRADIRKYNKGRTGDQRVTTSYVSRKISDARKKKREEARR